MSYTLCSVSGIVDSLRETENRQHGIYCDKDIRLSTMISLIDLID